MTRPATPDRAATTAGTPPAPRAGGEAARALLSEYAPLLLAAAYFLAASATVPGLGTPRNLSNLVVNVLPLLVAALGQTAVLIAGGIDLSIPAVVAACSVASARLMTAAGPGGLDVPSPQMVPAAVAIALGLGAGIGLFNGLAVAALRVPPFLVTLSTSMVVGGATLWATHSRNIANLPASFTDLAYGRVGGVPLFVPLVAALALAMHLMLGRTLIGRWLYAVGQNARASRVSGVPVGRVTACAYAVSGLCAAVAALLYTARLETGLPTMGREILLDVVGAAVIGGTSLAGGKGTVLGTVFGALLLALIDNSLNLIGLEYYAIMMAKGLVILLAASIDLLRARLLGRATP
ncbi:Ribose transport system permease protein RbsC [Aquisphaera giovannonii]|uniref:Ribose transport system permease protein RbsC n=1 Tax=Aquisphaera giovannonii TaxID=406548 RepID=A0A5B9W4M9_9BACT|nr:ABC transporter permease [Aquisphaera giovannonii]QEH35179.1 Ribose transport system permease protein RbsC [Aquisphaera giovannonii]